MLSAHLTLVCATLYVLFSERIFLKVASGGRGVLQLIPLAIILLSGVLLLFARDRCGTRFARGSGFWPFWFPYLSLAILLPMLGVAFGDYPFRTVSTSVPGFVAVSFLVMGSRLEVLGAAGRRLAVKYLFVAILVEFLFAAAQSARVQGLMAGNLLDVLYQWDLVSQAAYSRAYVITARSVGTYLNPNTLGFWSVIAFWSAVHACRGAPRVFAIAAALGTLALSQSRGSLLALLGSIALWLVYLAFSRDKALRPACDLAYALAGASLLGLLVAAAWHPGYLSSHMGKRFASGIAVIGGGVTMDPNASGRVVAWTGALQFYEQRPLGTLGEPQFLLGGFIDNDLLRLLLQGGPLFLLTALIALGAGVRQIEFGAQGRMIATCSAAIAVNAMTADPLNYPAIGLYWMVVGHYLAGRGQLLSCRDSCLRQPLQSP